MSVIHICGFFPNIYVDIKLSKINISHKFPAYVEIYTMSCSTFQRVYLVTI